VPKDLLIDNNSSININIMNFLSIDCSTNIGSLFIKTKNKTFSKVLQSDKFNNDLLMKRILDFFVENWQRKILILGEMNELGELSYDYHKEIVLYALKTFINKIIFWMPIKKYTA